MPEGAADSTSYDLFAPFYDAFTVGRYRACPAAKSAAEERDPPRAARRRVRGPAHASVPKHGTWSRFR